MRIIGPASKTYAHVGTQLGLQVGSPLFMNEMFPMLWNVSVVYGIDPVGVIAQAWKETGGGSFQGKAKPWFFNTCGLKVRHDKDVMALLGTQDSDHPLVHQIFPNWRLGAEAHVQHLAAYAGMRVGTPIIDPRYDYVAGKHWCVHFSDLGGKWAPAADYGIQVEETAKRLFG